MVTIARPRFWMDCILWKKGGEREGGCEREGGRRERKGGRGQGRERRKKGRREERRTEKGREKGRKDVWKDRKEEGPVHALLGEYKHVVEY